MARLRFTLPDNASFSVHHCPLSADHAPDNPSTRWPFTAGYKGVLLIIPFRYKNHYSRRLNRVPPLLLS